MSGADKGDKGKWVRAVQRADERPKPDSRLVGRRQIVARRGGYCRICQSSIRVNDHIVDWMGGGTWVHRHCALSVLDGVEESRAALSTESPSDYADQFEAFFDRLPEKEDQSS